MKHKAIILALLLTILATALALIFNIRTIKANMPEADPHLVVASKMPELESFFRYQEPWLGSDGAWSINISEFHPNTILWTFGDTLWGRIENNQKVWNMTNNSVALHNLENWTITFYDAEQVNIFEIAEWLEGDELFGPWPFAPFIQNGKIYWFPMVINLTGWTGGGDWLADVYLAEVDNPEEDPDLWNVNYYPIDFLPVKYESNSFLWLATDVYVENGTYYMYGERDGHYVVARTRENITLFDFWEFYDGENWMSTPQVVEGGPADLSTEYSVDYLPLFDKYLLIYQKRSWPTDSQIWGRWADTPIGPWSEPQLFYTPPELALDPAYWAYAIKGHYPYLSRTDREVVVSYVVRSNNEDETLSNPILYCPYFVKLTFENITTGMLTDHSVTYNGGTYNITTISNSSITNFQFNQSESVIGFSVNGLNYTGFCRITIPNILIRELWKGNYTVLVNGQQSPTMKNWTDGTNSYIYFTYIHPENEVTIIPEFSSSLISPLLIFATLIAVVFLKPICTEKDHV